MRGEVFALRRWSPEENSVVNGKFRRGWLELRGLLFHLWDEVQLRHILQQWGRVTKVARKSLKFVGLTKVTLRVEMLPNVVLPALLEVEDGIGHTWLQLQSLEKMTEKTLSGLSRIAARTS